MVAVNDIILYGFEHIFMAAGKGNTFYSFLLMWPAKVNDLQRVAVTKW